MTRKEIQALSKGLDLTVGMALSGKTSLRTVLHDAHPDRFAHKGAVASSSTQANLAMGRVRLGLYGTQSYIQVEMEDGRWKSVCHCSQGVSAKHKEVVQAVWDKALLGDWGEDEMRCERNRLVEL